MAATLKYPRLIICSAKYIEGLENRLARMESLMRLSGVLPEDDDGSTDLATIEKRLTDRAGRSATPRQSMSDDRRQSVVPQSGTSTNGGTPAQPTLPSPRSGTASPEPETEEEGEGKGKGKDGEDALAEMMCSLVTNNYGETRYIGESPRRCCMGCANSRRFFFRLLHLLAKGHSVGERKDRRQLLPTHDLHGSRRGQQVDTVATRRIPGHIQTPSVQATTAEARGSVIDEGLLRKLQLHVPAIPRADFHALGR